MDEDVRSNPARCFVCVQIAIFVLPVVCLVGWVTKHSFTLDLDPLSIIILTLSVIHACAPCSHFATTHPCCDRAACMLRSILSCELMLPLRECGTVSLDVTVQHAIRLLQHICCDMR